MTEHSRKMLLSFEAAGNSDNQDARLGRAQHLLRMLYSVTQNKLVWRLARRLAKHSRKMSWAQFHRLRHFDEGQLGFQLRMHELFNRPQARRRQLGTRSSPNRRE